MIMERKAWAYLSTTATNFLCLLGGVVSGIISARLLGPEGRGALATILYYPGLLSASFSLAMPQALSFFILKEPQRRDVVVAAGLRLALALTLVGGVSFALLSPLSLPPHFHHLGGQVALACMLGAVLVLNGHLAAVHRGLHHFDFVNVVLLGSAFLYPALLLLFWWLGHISPLAFALSSLLSQWLAAAAYMWRLARFALVGVVEGALYVRIFLQGCRLFMPVLVLTVYTLADRALLIRYGTATDLGHYAVACAVSFPVATAAEAFAQLGFIEMAGLDGSRAAGALMARRFQMAQVVMFLAVVALLPTAYFLVRYGFGPAFLPALSSTQLMIIAMALRGLSKTLENASRASNVVMPGIVSSAVALLGLVGMAWLLVPTRGILGLAQALLVSEVGCLLVLTLLVKRRFGFNRRDLWGITPSMFRVLTGHAMGLVRREGRLAR